MGCDVTHFVFTCGETFNWNGGTRRAEVTNTSCSHLLQQLFYLLSEIFFFFMSVRLIYTVYPIFNAVIAALIQRTVLLLPVILTPTGSSEEWGEGLLFIRGFGVFQFLSFHLLE